jgi:serine/threonine-protein kinase
VADEVNTKSGDDDDAESQPLPLSVGSVLDGRFHIERMLGAGGMGYVVLARHVALEERVAIKLLLPGRADEDARHRLVREARAAVKIKSDHVVRILDVVNTGPNAPYIVMEHLVGEDLAARLERGPLDPAVAAEVVVQACEVVGEAHYRGLAHRDIKPSNLFLVPKPGQPRFVKVLDFGISKVLDGGTERLTASNSLLGSPAYAAPEQLRDSRAVDRRCDVWALGVVLYECVVGQLPFSGATIAEVCMKILEQAPTPPPARSAVPERMLAIIDRCLQKDPGQRYDNLAELAIALREFAPRASDEALVYLSALGPPLPELPKDSARASATADTVLTAQGQTFDTKTEVAKRRPVALAILGFSAAAGAATFFSAKAMLPSDTVRSESTPAVVAASASVESANAASAGPPVASASSTPGMPSASATPNVEPIANPEPTASAVEPRSTVEPQRLRPKPLKPVKRPEKDAAKSAPWVDSR